MFWRRQKQSDIAQLRTDCSDWAAKMAKKYAEAKERAIEQANEIDQKREGLAEALAEWEADVLASRSYKPPVEVKTYPAGKFLCVAGEEVPLRFVEHIAISSPGERAAPGWVNAFVRSDIIGSYCDGGYVRRPKKASISIRLASGQEIKITCSPYVVDMLHGAAVKAWKGAKAT